MLRVFLLLLSFCNLSNAQTISIDKELHDYGVIEYKSDNRSRFIINNVGTQPLNILAIRYDKYKIKVIQPRVPIEPGDSFVLKIWYNSKRTGKFEQEIILVSNDQVNPEKIITLSGRVKSPALIYTVAMDFAIWIFLYISDYRFFL